MKKSILALLAMMALVSCSVHRFSTAEEIQKKYETNLGLAKMVSISDMGKNRGSAMFYWSNLNSDDDDLSLNLNLPSYHHSLMIFAYRDKAGWYIDDGLLKGSEISDGQSLSMTKFLKEDEMDAMVSSGELSKFLKSSSPALSSPMIQIIP